MGTDATTPPGWFRFSGLSGSYLVPVSVEVGVDCGDGPFTMSVRDSGGDGPAVVLVHGWMADSVSNWHCCIEPLADAGWRVLAVDLPGFGGSGIRGRWSMRGAADAVGRAVAATGVDEAVWCGYSLGGPVTLSAARADRAGELATRVRALALTATAARLVPSTARRVGLWGIERAWGTAGEAAVTVLGLRAGTVREREAGRADLARWGLWMAKVVNKRAAAQSGAALARFDARRWAGSLGVDAASVVTCGDRVVPVESQRELATLTGARVHNVDGDHRYCLMDGYGPVLVETLGRWGP